ncbi:LAME_0F00254g1_1 [Lachancea meyersii CBS 8951]|uniref:LAME_0F00254g1_1 n=1 Tax=Lachancea meyersii CBS 8951 TaxID=1266667 RepID=A0A1G4JP51_9SACH|nr:LAME_0F00254g1_1 [Lachancea meyersii CBS 8951]
MPVNSSNRRSRSGCSSCKRARIKCDETRPKCLNCVRRGEKECDYSLQLKWGGQFKRVAGKVSKDLPDAALFNGVLIMGKKRARLPNKNSKKGLDPENRPNGKVSGPTGHPEVITSTTPDFQTGDIVCLDASVLKLNQAQLEYSLEMDARSPQVDVEESSLSKRPLPIDRCSLNILQLAHPSPDILFNSAHHAELFEFYLCETSRLFVPTPYYAYQTNPFNTILPQLAMQSPTLLKLILAFAANHRRQIANYQQGSQSLIPLDRSTDNKMDGKLADQLLGETFAQLLSQLSDMKQRRSNSTLATILMLAGFDIFFCDTRNKWRAHINGARGLLLDKLGTTGRNAVRIAKKSRHLDTDSFLVHWFSYLNIIGSLSSVKRVAQLSNPEPLAYEFDFDQDVSVVSVHRAQLKDIDYFTGLETKLLSLLADVANLIDQKEACENAEQLHHVIPKALDLAHNIETYLDASEAEREQIYHQFYATNSPSFDSAKYKTYRTLRATNAVFALTAVLQLKRRVLGITRNSPTITILLLRITKLIHEEIPFSSSAESCITFCLFCCGCELIGSNLALHRGVYIDHMETLLRNGMSSARQARVVMEYCWRDEKSWWEIMEEQNLDLSFAI